MAWDLRKIVILAVILAVLVVGGVVGTVLLLDALRQPQIFVREANASLVDCRPGGFFTAPIENQYVSVSGFRLANVGEVAGNINVQILVDSRVVWDRTFLVLPGEEGFFSVSEVVSLSGCSAQVVTYNVASTWRA